MAPLLLFYYHSCYSTFSLSYSAVNISSPYAMSPWQGCSEGRRCALTKMWHFQLQRCDYEAIMVTMPFLFVNSKAPLLKYRFIVTTLQLLLVIYDEQCFYGC